MPELNRGGLLKFFTALLLIAAHTMLLPAGAAAISVGGSLVQEAVYSRDYEQGRGRLELDLDLGYRIDFDRRIYANPVLEIDINAPQGTGYELDLREAYLDYHLTDLDLRVGRQVVGWGSGYELNPTSRLSPLDFTAGEMAARRGVGAVKGEYYFDWQTSLTGAAAWEFRPHILPEHLERELEEALLEKGLELVIEEPDISDPTDAEMALKFTRRGLGDFDLSVSYHRGYEKLPGLPAAEVERLVPLPGGAGNEGGEKQAQGEKPHVMDAPREMTLHYRKTRSLGLDLIGSIGNYGVWGEAAYSRNEDDEDLVELVLGLDRRFPGELYTVLQYYTQRYRDYADEEILALMDHDLRRDQNYLVFHVEQPYERIHEWSLSALYDLDDGDYLCNPEFTYSVTEDLSLELGLVLARTGEGTFLDLMGEEMIYAGLTHSF